MRRTIRGARSTNSCSASETWGPFPPLPRRDLRRAPQLDVAIYGLTPGNSYSYRVRFAHCHYQGLNCYEIEYSDWAYVSITIPAPAEGAVATPTPMQ